MNDGAGGCPGCRWRVNPPPLSSVNGFVWPDHHNKVKVEVPLLQIQLWLHMLASDSDYFESVVVQPNGADVVIIQAGVPRKPGMSRDDLFNINVGMVKGLCTAITKYYPHVFKNAGTYDEKRLFGVTKLDVVKAKTFYAGKSKIFSDGITNWMRSYYHDANRDTESDLYGS
ncbi:hypothetical protein L1987_40626 [Smallanthus sonchifolius]|uniref:Uncharacterized protein n=1 Tax=Smallanthus sonchifolius TaxID=185202 RepID=A0ACB9GTE0_9ASTR|nr:hypothetical protein L1987_40626 [Smallanthus sonchifolius]